MEKEKKELDTKSIHKYWWFIFKRAFQIAIKESEMKGWIKATMIAGIAAGILWLFAKNKIIPQNMPIVGGLTDNFYVQIVLGIGAAIIFGVAFLFSLIFVPAQEHYKQEASIKNLENELQSESLNILVEDSKIYVIPDKDGNQIYSVILSVTNQDKRNKIIELQASTVYIRQTFLQGDKELTQEQDRIVSLEWQNGGTKMELLPETRTLLKVSRLGSEPSHSVHFGISEYSSAFFEKESVFTYQIKFQGRYEKEWEYRKHTYTQTDYSNPIMQRLAKGSDALGWFSNEISSQIKKTLQKEVENEQEKISSESSKLGT